MPDWVPGIGGNDIGVNIATIPRFANGTDNFNSGGIAMVGERGRELVNLPQGSQVIPNRRTESILNGLNSVNSSGNVNFEVNLNINGKASQEDIREAVSITEIEFEKMLKRVLQNNKRLAF